MCQVAPGPRCATAIRGARRANRQTHVAIATDLAVLAAEWPTDPRGNPLPDRKRARREEALHRARWRATVTADRLADEWARSPAGRTETAAARTPGTVEHATALATRLFDRVLGKVGEPYLDHLLAVEAGIADRNDTRLRIAAVLHDAIEDIPEVDRAYLLRQGIPADAVDLIEAVTHPKGEPYAESIRRVIDAGPRAVALKLSDLGHNTDPERNAAFARVRVGNARRAALAAGFDPVEAENDAHRAIQAHARRYRDAIKTLKATGGAPARHAELELALTGSGHRPE